MAPELAISTFIAANTTEVYEALIESHGLASFWTADSLAEPIVGSIGRFGFPTGSRLELRVEQLEPGRRVVWTLLNDVRMGPRWAQTRVSWDLNTRGDSSTEVLFRQTNWPEGTVQADLAGVTYAWAQILRALKAYLETGMPAPYFAPVSAQIG